jgi:hypothetical protein
MICLRVVERLAGYVDRWAPGAVDSSNGFDEQALWPVDRYPTETNSRASDGS